jgi:hypothetical protein
MATACPLAPEAPTSSERSASAWGDGTVTPALPMMVRPGVSASRSFWFSRSIMACHHEPNSRASTITRTDSGAPPLATVRSSSNRSARVSASSTRTRARRPLRAAAVTAYAPRPGRAQPHGHRSEVKR